MANSSPPSRATTSPARTTVLSRSATSHSRVSPCWWPRVSLTSLNRSRSSSSRPKRSPVRALASTSASSRSPNSDRFGHPGQPVVQGPVRAVGRLPLGPALVPEQDQGAQRQQGDVDRTEGDRGGPQPAALGVRLGQVVGQLAGVGGGAGRGQLAHRRGGQGGLLGVEPHRGQVAAVAGRDHRAQRLAVAQVGGLHHRHPVLVRGAGQPVQVGGGRVDRREQRLASGGAVRPDVVGQRLVLDRDVQEQPVPVPAGRLDRADPLRGVHRPDVRPDRQDGQRGQAQGQHGHGGTGDPATTEQAVQHAPLIDATGGLVEPAGPGCGPMADGGHGRSRRDVRFGPVQGISCGTR